MALAIDLLRWASWSGIHATKRRIHDLKFHRLHESLDFPKTSAKQPGRLFSSEFSVS
jgi:hypothetical protein